MRLMRGRHNIGRVVKFGGFAMVPGCVLVMFSRKFVEFTNADTELPSSVQSPRHCVGPWFGTRSLCSAGQGLSLASAANDRDRRSGCKDNGINDSS